MAFLLRNDYSQIWEEDSCVDFLGEVVCQEPCIGEGPSENVVQKLQNYQSLGVHHNL